MPPPPSVCRRARGVSPGSLGMRRATSPSSAPSWGASAAASAATGWRLGTSTTVFQPSPSAPSSTAGSTPARQSLCRAGVLPAVEEGALGDGWKTVVLVPSRHPVAALAAALAPQLGAEEGDVARRIPSDPGETPRALRQTL